MKINNRHFLLLEVLIAFCLIAFCMVPLIYPHIVMIKAQKEFINKIKINHAINLLYIDILEKMHKNEISLNDIESKKTFTQESEEKKFPGYKFTYQFINERHKKRNSDGITVHLATLRLSLTPKTSEKTKHFDYDIFFGSKKDPEIEDKEAEDDEEG